MRAFRKKGRNLWWSATLLLHKTRPADFQELPRTEQEVRKFAPLYSSTHNAWQIIFQDDYEEEWYVFTDLQAMPEETAKSIASALNLQERNG